MLWIINCISSTSHISIVLWLGTDHKGFSRLRHLFLAKVFTFIRSVRKFRHSSQQIKGKTVLGRDQISKWNGLSEVARTKKGNSPLNGIATTKESKATGKLPQGCRGLWPIAITGRRINQWGCSVGMSRGLMHVFCFKSSQQNWSIFWNIVLVIFITARFHQHWALPRCSDLLVQLEGLCKKFIHLAALFSS